MVLKVVESAAATGPQHCYGSQAGVFDEQHQRTIMQKAVMKIATGLNFEQACKTGGPHRHCVVGLGLLIGLVEAQHCARVAVEPGLE